MIIKEKYENWKAKPKIWKTKYTVIICLLIALIGGGITYTYFTQHGRFFQEDIKIAFNSQKYITKDIRIFTNGNLIQQYVGYYNVIEYAGHYIVLDYTQQERIDVYGDVVIVVDIPIVEE